jgi:hypothetical protein
VGILDRVVLDVHYAVLDASGWVDVAFHAEVVVCVEAVVSIFDEAFLVFSPRDTVSGWEVGSVGTSGLKESRCSLLLLV